MTLRIRFLFRALDIDDSLSCEADPSKIVDCVQRRRCAIEAQLKVPALKAYLRVPAPHNAHQYLALSSSRAAQAVAAARESVVVEFFHGSRAETVRARVAGVAEQLQRRERELKALIGELKDESSLFYAVQIISKASKASFSDFEDVIQVAVVVSEPLVDCQGDSALPLFCEQVDVCSHIERLRRASVAECSLSVLARRCHASRSELAAVLGGGEGGRTRIVELFTRVERVEGRVMVSLEGAGGEQVWEEAGELLARCEVDLLIVIGIGAHLLAEVPYGRPLILLTSVSVEENRLGDTSYSRDRFALAFLERFFQGVFKRLPVKESFEGASLEAREHLENYLWCCCLHAHAADCGWARVVRRVGSQQAHRLFRHTFEEWKAVKFYPLSSALQQIILEGTQGEGAAACAQDNLCCWNRQGANKLELHKNLSKVLHWNGLEYEASDGMLLSLKLNKFEGEVCDRPLLRTRPLTVYRVLQLVAHHRICVLRAHDPCLARRILAQAVDYLRCRDPGLLFCELEMEREVRVERELFGYLKSLKRRGAGRVRLLVGIVERGGGSRGDAYEQFMQDPRLFLQNARLVYELEIALSFVVVTANPSFQGEYPAVHLSARPHPQEKYFEILHSYRSEHLSPNNPQCWLNLACLRQQIEEGAADNRQEVRERCAEIRSNAPEAFLFLGFLALFADDGLYLTKATTPLLEHLFSAAVVASAVGRELPVESSVFPNCVFLQLAKPYREEFSEVEGEAFSLKQLEYYNLLLRVHAHFARGEAQSFLGSFQRREGLFCISIEPEDDHFPSLLSAFRAAYSEEELGEVFFNHSNFKTIYHVNQIERIITANLKRKRAKLFQQVKISSISEGELAPSILLWSMVQKLCLLLRWLQRQFAEKVRQLEALLTVFLLRAEVRHTLVQIARIQLSLILEQRPQRLAEGLAHEQLAPLLTYLHLYSLRLSALTATASPHKFREALYNCFSFVYKLKECCENRQVRQEFARHRLSAVLPETLWYRELLRLIQRKVLFYFGFVRSRRVRSEEEGDFARLLNLGEIRYEFQNLYLRLPEGERRESDLVLLDHYIRISLNEALADNSLLFALRSGISAEMQPIYQHLCLKVDKRTLFSGKRLVVLARARNSFLAGQPYIFNRKRYLTVPCLSQLLEGSSLKSSYFNLTAATLQHLAQAAPAELLHLLLCIDATEDCQLLIGSESSVEAVVMPVADFAEQLSKLKIKVLMLLGKNAVAVCGKMRERFQLDRGKPHPFILALQSTEFSMNDCQLHEYPSTCPNYVWKYLQNEVYLMAVDFIALSTVWKVNERLKAGTTLFTPEVMGKIFEEGIKNAKRILSSEFQCVEETFRTFRHQVWGSQQTMDKIEEGVFEDLTSKFYSSEHNFYHYIYYENVGRCREILSMLSALQRPQLIEVVGAARTGKSTILHEVSWTAQIKGLFELGISIFDATRNPDELREFLASRKFRERAEGAKASLMIAIDNLDHSALDQHSELFEKLASKAVTIVVTCEGKEVGTRLRKLLSCSSEGLVINMDRVELHDVFGLLLSGIKDFSEMQSPNEEMKYTRESIGNFQARIEAIMGDVCQAQQGQQISKAVQLLKGKDNAEKRHESYYNFYKGNYDKLVLKLKEKKELQLKFV